MPREMGDAFEGFEEDFIHIDEQASEDDHVLPPDDFIDWDEWGDYDMAFDWDHGDADAYPGAFAIVSGVSIA